MDFATEKGYIEAVSRGDEQAFESLFLHYFPRIKGFISGILQNEEEAEDISQDIFVSMWQNRDRLKEIENLNAYLYRIAKNTVFRHIERSLLFRDYQEQQTNNASFSSTDNDSIEEELYAKELEFLISKEKNNYLIWEELLMLYNQLEDTTAMYRGGLECLKYFPNEPLPYVMISLPLLIRKDLERAKGYLEQGLDLSPDNSPIKAQFFAYLGEVYYKQDSVEQAFAMFDSTLLINPGDIMTLNNYSYYLSLRNEHLDKAEKMISTALSADPNNSTFLDTYAWVLFKSKNYSLAKFYMRSAIENEKNPSGVLYEHYGDILFMNGEKEEAVKMWQKALEFRDEECGDLKYKIENGLSVDHEK